MTSIAAASAPKRQMNPEDLHVLELLRSHTYDQVREMMPGWSRGRIYALALETGQRKTENRIRERHAERQRRQAEFLQQMTNLTAKADVLDFVDGIPDDSVSMHITSVPYNLGKQYGDAPLADLMRFTYFHGWLMMIISEMARTLKSGGVLCLNTGKTRDWEEHLYPMDVMLFEDLRRAGLTYQSRIIWRVNHGLTPERRLAERYETVLVFSKGEVANFNPTVARVPQKGPGKRAFKGPNKGQLSGHPLGAHPTDVWDDIPQVGHNHPDTKHGKHPAQFPVKLVKRAILLYTKPGDLVVDIFSGSGSTPVAAIETGRDFTGADLFYEDLRAQRIAHAAPDLVTPLPGVSAESIAVWQAEARRVDKVAPKITAAVERRQCVQLGLLDAAAAA